MFRRRLATLACALAAIGAAGADRAIADPVGATPISDGWQIQSSSAVAADGQAVSTPGFETAGWYPVSPRSTVFAGLLENGLYPNPFYSTNLRDKVNEADFQVPWWYRADFAADPRPGQHTRLTLGGVISRADVWVNGTKVASKDEVVGAWRGSELDVTDLIEPGRNTVALLVDPNDPYRDLTLGWIDWNPAPPDRNMGLWDDVKLDRSAAVDLSSPRVLTELEIPSLRDAKLTVKFDARNLTDRPVTTTVAGRIGPAEIEERIELAPNETRTITADPVTLDRPRVWWPRGMGDQPLYRLELAARTADGLSDTAQTTFGIRDVRAPLVAQGHRRFEINGRPLLIRGAGWASDMFLRFDPDRLEDQLDYVEDIGLNALRMEGKLETDEFYDLADRRGILLLPGWECCNKWEAWADVGEGGEPWTQRDFEVAKDSTATQARRLRNHPSVIAFLIASDHSPPADVETNYLEALRANDWPLPIISSAQDESSPQTGSSGMKMFGPYDWVPPAYWYEQQRGGAFGFGSELSAGKTIPTIDSLRAQLSPQELDDLWQRPDVKQYHAAPPRSIFSTLTLFHGGLANRYGAPRSLEDYVMKAQALNYEGARAQFEAYIRNQDAANPSTGLIYWMLTGWPSLNWHLFGNDYDQPGAYWGAKKANEPLHVQYSLDDRSVVAANQTPRDARGLTAIARVHDLDGRVRSRQRLNGVDVPALGTRRLFAVPDPSGISTTYFVELELRRGGRTVSRNVYWQSTRPDLLDWENSDWYFTPTSQYADLTGLQRLPEARVRARAHTRREGEDAVTTVTLRNASRRPTVAFLMNLTVRRGRGGERVLPISWSDNDVTLWPGQSITLTARYRAADLEGERPSVELTGWNVPRRAANS